MIDEATSRLRIEIDSDQLKKYGLQGDEGDVDDEKTPEVPGAELLDAVETAIRRRIDAGLSPILVTVHSFTPAYQGKIRDVELGVVHDADPRLANMARTNSQTPVTMPIAGPQFGICEGSS